MPPREILNRETVIVAARRMIVEDGLEAVSLRRLAGVLGVTAPALYAYVSDKGDLLQAVANAELARLMDRFSLIEDGSSLERLRQLLHTYLDFTREQPELFRTMFNYPPHVPAYTTPETVKQTYGIKTPLDIIEEAIEDGHIREIDPAMVALILWVAAHGLAHAQLIGVPFDSDFGDVLTEQVIDTMLRGLRP